MFRWCRSPGLQYTDWNFTLLYCVHLISDIVTMGMLMLSLVFFLAEITASNPEA